jgi:hypothetical protein
MLGEDTGDPDDDGKGAPFVKLLVWVVSRQYRQSTRNSSRFGIIGRPQSEASAPESTHETRSVQVHVREYAAALKTPSLVATYQTPSSSYISQKKAQSVRQYDMLFARYAIY